jgi:hypothetical protein
MRDTHATGTGSIMGAGTAGYCVGNLQLDGATLPHEDPNFVYPDNLASPQQVCTASSMLGFASRLWGVEGLEAGLGGSSKEVCFAMNCPPGLARLSRTSVVLQVGVATPTADLSLCAAAVVPADPD